MRAPIGWYEPGTLADGKAGVVGALRELGTPFGVVRHGPGLAAATGGRATLGGPRTSPTALELLAFVPALEPDQLGDPGFQATYGTRVNYIAGAMANGIGSTDVVIAMARAGMIGFFGAAGLTTERIDAAITTIRAAIGEAPQGFNLIHSPAEPRQEQETVDLFLARGVTVASASAFMSLTPPVVQYRATGLREVGGKVVPRNHVLAKLSRTEVAERFLRPPPKNLLDGLVAAGRITAAEAALAARLPMASDITAEADSGGHTDNRPLPVLLPLFLDLRARVARDFAPAAEVRIGAGGGLGEPSAVAAAFALGAAYVLTGTVNQACVEAGTSDMVREMLADAGMADVGMAPASDMFEQGVQVQVLTRGTMFAARGRQLYEIYREYASLDALPTDVRDKLEQKLLRKPLAEVWDETRAFWAGRDPRQVERALREPKHKMALCFRWYLGLSSRWAIAGVEDRRQDAQIWCGPAIGSFNAWTAGSFLHDPRQRRVSVVGANLMAGAAALTRARRLVEQGVDPGPEAFGWTPRPLAPA